MVKHTQTICRLFPTNCLSEFDHFVESTLKVLTIFLIILYHPLPLCLMLEDNSETVKTKQLENLNDNSKNVFFKIF